LGKRRKVEILFGTAGWDYPDWAGRVYPKPKPKGFDPLAYLADYVGTIEINSTFYRPPSAAVARAWAKRVAHRKGFAFTAKLYRRFTHERGTAWTAKEAAEPREGFDALAEAGVLGAVLMQFPWSFRNEEKNREWLNDLSRAFSAYPLALEVRHESWNEPAFYAELSQRGIGFVNIDQPLFKKSIKPSARATSSIGYVRVHGRNYQDWFRKTAGRDERYDYLYSSAELEPWAERTNALSAEPGVEKVFVVNNNHFHGKALVNALMLQELVTGKPIVAPPELVKSYPRELLPITNSR
jgi:uncharacterized protein YecE (DUF72 family)